MKLFKPVALGAGAFIYSVLTLQTALADDTEIYVPKDLPADQQVRPNILFVLDSSGSMSSSVSGTTPTQTRIQVLRSVVNNLIDQIKVKEDVNVGFMRFNTNTNDTNNGGYVLSPVERLTNANAAAMKTIVNGIGADDNTPLLETYYEAYLYMTGQNRLYGNKSVITSRVGGGEQYKTPIEHSCQKNHIIYVTDGAPTNDVNANSRVKTLVTGKNTLYTAASCGTGQGQCLPHLAEYMANQDLFPSPVFSDPTNRKQTVTSHFIGFAINLPLLQNAAAAGGGSYYTSNNVSGLTDALKAIIVDITADNTSFAAPSVAVSAFNNLGYRNDLYYALFRPAEGTRWPGNVKRYKLGKDASNNPLIVDKNGNAAIDDATGFFSDSSSSFWSNADGKDVAKGGVAAQLLTPDSRTVLTWTSADRLPGSTASATLAPLNDANTSVTSALLGAASPAERTTFINWARGKNTDNSARLKVGDVLHNEPKLVAYTTDENLVRVGNSQKPPSDPDYQVSPEQLYMFFGDNEGFIHAIDPSDGSEKFAFIPKELLKNPGDYFKDAKGAANKRYGIDGQINLWTEYSALNSVSKTRSLNKAYLYAGMRRGGSNYYALDVLNINAPTLKWVIKGPEQTLVGGNYTNAATGFTTGYAKLGRTFSAPKLAKLKVNGVETKVLIFTGGYDLDQDNVGTNIPKNDDIGNSLYVANADTGELIWHASNSGAQLNIPLMTNSMPADPTLVDINGDGLIDIAYASDLRGQVFRFDFNSENTGGAAIGANAFATGGRFASLAGSTVADNRRFFSSPDVALIRERGGKTYFTVSIGAGFRESPLNQDTNDRFYVLRDSDVYTKPASYTSVVEGDLTDVTSVNLSAPATAGILADIAALEGQITALNLALSNAQTNFTNYKESIGHTAKQNAANQAFSDANAKQKQIDAIAEGSPYLAEHTLESAQQSLLQNSLARAQEVLIAVEQARVNAQAVADATDATALELANSAAQFNKDAANSEYALAQTISNADASAAAAALAAVPPDTTLIAVTAATAAASAANTALKLAARDTAVSALTAATTARDNAVTDDSIALYTASLTSQFASEYQKLINFQAALDSAYSSVSDQETAIIAAKADPDFDSDLIPGMEAELNTRRADYLALPGATKRTDFNSGTPTAVVAQLNNVLATLSGATPATIASDLTLALNALKTSIDLPALGSEPSIPGLIALDETARSALLQAEANNNASSTALVNSLQAQVTALTASAVSLKSEANVLAAQLYSGSPSLTSPQLIAARASVAPAGLTAFAAYQYLVDLALANASNPTTGLPKLRADINVKYALLTPGDSYTPNVSLLDASKGFFLRLPKGEKVLSSSLSFRGSVFFSTFSPTGGAPTSTCGSDVGKGRTYAMSLIDASAIYVKDVAGTKTPIRSFILKRSGIPPTPSVILSDGIPTVLTGTEVNREECIAGVEACRTNDAVKATYWREN
ncbi:MAG: pilus assembly protein PilY [Pseudomonadaceae bacterium]|nr:pilus assembly protein PilY [Pseudomonadaceae bacterium]